MMITLLLFLFQEADLKVSIDFPGGSAQVESVDAATRTLKINPSLHPDRGWRCWWYFRLDGLTPGETLTLDVGEAPWATPDRAMTSVDDREWVHSAPGKRTGKRIAYAVPVKAKTQWFAWGPPFTLRHAEEAVAEALRACPAARPFELARTRGGRPVPALRLTETDAPDRFGIWVQARQHAWESGGSWVGRGFLEWISSDDARAVALRKRAEIVFVPIMDVDNAELGAGGKGALPQDHNRDWSDAPHHPEVRAAQAAIRAMADAGRFDVFIDLHNPGAGDGTFFFTSVKEAMSERGRRNHEAFFAAAKVELSSALAFNGQTRESGPAYDPKNWQKISKNWVARNAKDHVVSLTLETAWNRPESTLENYRRVGRELGLAIEKVLVPGFRR